MNMNVELQAIMNRLFDNNLFDTVLAAYKQEMEETGYGVSEMNYAKGSKALFSVLNEKQKSSLSEIENLYRENTKYALKFGFTRGIYTGFQQFFIKDTTIHPFREFVSNEILTEPHVRRYIEYSQRRDQFNHINELLENTLDETNREHLVSICTAWEDRLYGVLRHSFYIGYRYALSVIEEIGPIGISMEIIEKTLLTEYELGFVNTVAEQERRNGSRAHKKGEIEGTNKSAKQ